MSIIGIFAEVCVADIERSVAWYTKFFGRPPEDKPMDGLVQCAMDRQAFRSGVMPSGPETAFQPSLSRAWMPSAHASMRLVWTCTLIGREVSVSSRKSKIPMETA